MILGSVIQATTCISTRQRGHSRGSTSKGERLRTEAAAELRKARDADTRTVTEKKDLVRRANMSGQSATSALDLRPGDPGWVEATGTAGGRLEWQKNLNESRTKRIQPVMPANVHILQPWLR